MSRVALQEPLFLATVPISFGRGWGVRVYVRGTTTLVAVYSAESGGTELVQPLATDLDGRPKGQNGEDCWIEPGSYDIAYSDPKDAESPVVLPYEAARGGAGGGGGGGEELLTAAGMGVVVHEGDDEAERPSGFKQILWVGSVTPENIAVNDIYINTENSSIYIATSGE